MNRPTMPRSFRVYALCVVSAASIAFFVSALERPASFGVFLVLLALVTIAAEVLALELPSGGSTSLAYPLTMATVVLLGPTAGGVVAALSALNPHDVRQRKPPLIVLFNASQLVLATIASGWLYVWLGGAVLSAGSASRALPQQVAALFCLAASSVALNALLVSIGMSLYQRVALSNVWRGQIGWMFPIQFALASLGFAVAEVLAVQPLGFVLFLFPLLVSRQMYQRYIGLRDAYRDTVRSLVAAIEAKDHYTRGHSERVAEYAVEIARNLNMNETAVERIEFAALLHDLGKVGISGATLMKNGPLSAAEWAEIREHPMIGARIVEGVPYLADIVGAVRYHHERYDGKGYCEGLAGDALPLEARVLAVADSYDAMTTERPYRPALSLEEAIAEIEAGRGSQFDPRAADAFLAWLAPQQAKRETPEVGSIVVAVASEDV